MYRNALTRHALALMPAVQAIVVICDPIGRLEKSLLQRHFCNDDPEHIMTDAEEDSSDGASAVAPEKGCVRSASALLEMPAFLREHRVSRQLRNFFSLLQGRLLLFHQDLLRGAPESIYNALAKLLGAGPFPRRLGFYRFNSHRGHRTDLCRNASLVIELRRRLRPEYEALERLLADAEMPVPPSLTQRLTRCDRPEELTADGGARCGNHTRCKQ
eukprot:TRINITY_DN3486_c0_g1_i1.p2 TRINITY_DN3486_c0_g1~~TRINITY_DN3486_c0_g1_i1.p2  ORF type:complete len:215 (+),score=46.46 TRINITY_DN3486_c0_g1_i1:2452-3096(+)